MKTKNILFYFFILISVFGIAQTTPIPDANFEQKLIDLSIDTNGLNGNILNSDAQAVTTLTISGSTVTNFTGLEAFVNVVNLDLGDNQFTTVPLTTLTALETFKFGKNDLLASLNFSQNIQLKSVDIQSDIFSSVITPSITTLDLSTNINLEYLRIRIFNNLSNLILPVTTSLTEILIYNIADPTLDFSLTSALEDLTVSGSYVSVTITLPNVYTNLKTLYIQSINIPTIDVSDYINLERITYSNTDVQDIVLPNSTTLTRIDISHHNLQNLESFASLPNLERLTINYNDTTPLTIDVSQNLVLQYIDLSYNDMTTLDLTQNVILEDIDISNNAFTNIDLTQNVLAEDIDVSYNLLPVLNVTQNVVLERLSARYNLLPTIDLTQNVELRYLYLNNNLLPTLNITLNIELVIVDISNNLFTTTGLDLTQNIELSYLKASYNQIESLNILQTVSLSSLIIDHNLFTGTSILDQFFTVRQNDYDIRGGTLDVSFNFLSGNIPDYASLFHLGAGGQYDWTRYFEFLFHNNNFEFGHFENQHAAYVLATTTISPPPFNSVVMRKYWYAPQAKVNTIDTINANAGDNITLTTVVSGAQNHYVWFKDGVQIPGAPDSPNYVINNVNSCDIGVYHSEIRSDLVPFENANAPGTQGKNLLLIRNDITLNVNYTASCVTLNSPANGATNVPINGGISWNGNLGACGYFVSIGTTPGGTNLANNIDVGDVTTYNLGTNFPANTLIYVTITPYFQTGSALVCPSESFTTSASTVLPDCTTLLFPTISATDVPVDSNITWNPSLNATGYFISVGTTPGGTDIANLVDVGNVTTYDPINDFAEGVQIYVTIIPYNSLGNAMGCSEESFTTYSNVPLPLCTTLTLPLNNANDVPVSSNISWNAATDATGYFISYGTNTAGNNIANMIDVGNVLTYNPPTDFPDETTIYVSITPYNSTGNAVSCTTESFETEVVIPVCTSLTSPLNNATNVSISSNISWNTVSNATGYFISYGTNTAGNNIANMIDVGNVLTYNPPTDFPDETLIYVTITPYNSAGNAIGCSFESFETEVVIPVCTNLTMPLNNATDVSISSNISWNAISNATGYLVSIGTTSGGTDLANMINVISNTFNPTNNFPDEATIYVTIIPYNSAGNAIGCSEESFETEVVIPVCTNLTSPMNNATDVSISSSISWNVVSNATGYFISYGTNTAGNNIANMIDVGNTLTYNPTNSLPDDILIYVKITPYNSTGNAIVCSIERFKTEIVEPDCTSLIYPQNGSSNVEVDVDISWYSVSNATGYFISIGTSPNGNDIANMIDVGNKTFYNPTNDLPDDAIIFVTILPYNSVGTSISGCSQESFKIENRQIITPAFFTPNGDGFNDVWKIYDPKNEVKTIYIFDRYGKLLHNIPNTNGSWNGTFGNQILSATDYWFVIERKKGEPVKGHFSLIR